MPGDLEERLKRLESDRLREYEHRVIQLEKDFDKIERELSALKSIAVSKDEFGPIQKVVYTAVGFIITTFLGIIYNFISRGSMK